MKKLILIAMVIAVLTVCWVSLMAAGYTWWQAAGFDFILTVMWLVILLIIKCGQDVKELRGKGDGFYE